MHYYYLAGTTDCGERSYYKGFKFKERLIEYSKSIENCHHFLHQVDAEVVQQAVKDYTGEQLTIHIVREPQ